MQKNEYNYKVLLVILLFIFYLITQNKEVLESVTFSITLWKDNLFPTLFPFLVASNLLLEYGGCELIGNILNKPLSNIFRINSNSGFVLIVSLFSGFPSGAINTINLLKNNKITYEEANHLITFTHYANPIFIINFIGNILNKRIAYLILISHILSGLIVGKIFSLKKEKIIINNKRKKNITNPLFSKAFDKAIKDSLKTIFILLGIITIFLIFSSIIETYIKLPKIYNILISGILEMTQGINKLLYLNINNYIKTILISLFISFGGLSVHMQVLSIINECQIKYKHFFIARVLHSIIAIMLVSLLYFIVQYP